MSATAFRKGLKVRFQPKADIPHCFALEEHAQLRVQIPGRTQEWLRRLQRTRMCPFRRADQRADMIKPKVVKAIGTVTGAAVASAEMSIRSNLYITHLLTAAAFAREIGELQQMHASEPVGEPCERILSLAYSAALSSVASVEAYLNGLFEDAARHFNHSMLPMFGHANELIERSTILEKSDWFLLLRTKPILDRGSGPSQKLPTLVKLRNALTHYRPEWDHEDRTHAKLSKDLERLRLKPNPWMAGRRLWFPQKWAGHDGAAWTVKTSHDFIEHVASAAGLPRAFVADYDERLKTG